MEDRRVRACTPRKVAWALLLLAVLVLAGVPVSAAVAADAATGSVPTPTATASTERGLTTHPTPTGTPEIWDGIDVPTATAGLRERGLPLELPHTTGTFEPAEQRGDDLGFSTSASGGSGFTTDLSTEYQGVIPTLTPAATSSATPTARAVTTWEGFVVAQSQSDGTPTPTATPVPVTPPQPAVTPLPTGDSGGNRDLSVGARVTGNPGDDWGASLPPLPEPGSTTPWSEAPTPAASPGPTQAPYNTPRPKTLRNKVAVAKVWDATGRSIGSVSFSWCHNLNRHRPGFPDGMRPPSSVQVNVNLANCSLGDQTATLSMPRCAYQINEFGLGLDEGDAAVGVPQQVCRATAAPFDHRSMSDGVRLAQPQGVQYIKEELYSRSEEMDCNDASRNTLAALTKCPVGSLSRIFGGRSEFFDELLATHDTIIGRSLLVTRQRQTAGDARSMELACGPIEFWDNCATPEKNALLDFKRSMDDNPLLSSWQRRRDMCSEFLGVSCNDNGHVVALELPFWALSEWRIKTHNDDNDDIDDGRQRIEDDDNVALFELPPVFVESVNPGQPETPEMERQWSAPLDGTIPRSIGHLDFLQILNLAGHNLRGKLPPSLVDLASLRILDLRDNDLTGGIPAEYSTLAALEEVHLEDNDLEGNVPPEIFALPSLSLLNLTNDGICGTFQFTNSSADIKLNPCDENGEPLVPPPPSGGDTFATWVLLVVILPSILLLSTSISCFALVLHKRRQGAAQTEHEPLPPATGTALDVEADDPESGKDSSMELVDLSVAGEDGESKSFPEFRVRVMASDGSAKLQSRIGSDPCLQSGSPSLRPSNLGGAGGVPLPPPPSAIKPPAGMDDNPTLNTRCPSGYSPLEYAGLPPEVEADSSRILGSGGYGVVYYGMYATEGGAALPAAIKVISNSDYDEAHSSKFKTFQDEVDMILLFRGNDCIVQVYSYCLEFPRAYIVYEYLPNDTLARYIHNAAARRSYLQILQIGYGIAEGLHALHQMNVIHRDLKPDNILLDEHMRPKLTDFGISRKKDADVSCLSTQNLGTWAYMAPEQFHGKISERSDMYAVGLILWECWTMKRPWEVQDDRDVWQMVFTILSEEKRPEIPDDCPKGLRALLGDCWANDPKQRPTSLELKSRLWKLMAHQSRRKPPTAGNKEASLHPGLPLPRDSRERMLANPVPCEEPRVQGRVLQAAVPEEHAACTPADATKDWGVLPGEQPQAGPLEGEPADSGNMLPLPRDNCWLQSIDSHPLGQLRESFGSDAWQDSSRNLASPRDGATNNLR